MPNIYKIKKLPPKAIVGIAVLPAKIWKVISLMLLISIFIFIVLIGMLASRWSIFAGLQNKLNRLIKVLDRPKENNVSKVELISLALKNMRAKKTRSVITIGGMMVGIAAIVFLVSIGFGMQSMIINRVARLEEMKQMEVAVPPGSHIKLDDEVIDLFSQIQAVEMVLPQISVIGKVTFNQAATDVAVYGVSGEYLLQSAIAPNVGKIFTDVEGNFMQAVPDAYQSIVVDQEQSQEQETDSVIRIGDVVDSVRFSITDDNWLELRQRPSPDAQVIGYTSRAIGEQTAERVWGEWYEGGIDQDPSIITAQGEQAAKWIKAQVPVWEKIDGNFQPVMDEGNQHEQSVGFLYQSSMTVAPLYQNQTTQFADAAATDITEEGWILIEGISDLTEQLSVSQVALPESLGELEAVVNLAFLRVLGLEDSQVVGQQFEVSYIATGRVVGDSQTRIESHPATYTIVGVTPDDRTPLVYVPLAHLQSLGVQNYSQLKIVVDSENQLADARTVVESYGFYTSSVVDTVAQISSLFSTARLLLALMGSVALTVASLGMFNTLTVSLLERTREIGLLKAMGMKSDEIKTLFLAESMLMGSLGGILGIVFGLLVGKILEFGLSAYAISQGVGAITVVDMPITFGLTIILLSFGVGVLTGIYPARRATKISALNALRYE